MVEEMNNGHCSFSSDKDFQSVCIDKVRWILALLLVLFHTFTSTNIPDWATPSTHPTTLLAIRIVDAFLSDLIVPVFFFISGFLFFFGKKWTKEVYYNKLKRRIKSLLIPYLIWNGLGVLIISLKLIPGLRELSSCPEYEIHFTLSNLLSCFWMYDGSFNALPGGTIASPSYYPINTALWYIRDLIIVVLCTPLLYPLLKRLKYGIVVLFGSVYIFLSYYYIDWHLNQLATAFLFFSWGAVYGVQNNMLPETFNRTFRWAILLYPLCSLGYLVLAPEMRHLAIFVKLVNTFAIVLFTFCAVGYLLKHHYISNNSIGVGAKSTFLYVAHYLVISRMMRVLMIFINPTSDLAWLCCYLLTAILSICLLLVIYNILKKNAPSLLNILIGRK